MITYFPIAYLTLRPILAGIDSNIEGMALSLGASRWRVFRTVTLPLSIPGLANAFLLLFAASLADFATPLILAGNQFPVLPTQAFLQITGMFDLRGGAALSFVLLVPALIVFLLQRYWVSRRFYVTDHRQGRGPGAVRQRLARRAQRCCSRSASWSRWRSPTSTCCCSTRRWSSRWAPITRSRWQHYKVIFTDGVEGDPRHADHRRLRDAAGRALRRAARLPRHQEGSSSAAARWNSCR